MPVVGLNSSYSTVCAVKTYAWYKVVKILRCLSMNELTALWCFVSTWVTVEITSKGTEHRISMLNVSYSLKSDFSPDLKLIRTGHHTFTRFNWESFILSNARIIFSNFVSRHWNVNIYIQRWYILTVRV